MKTNIRHTLKLLARVAMALCILVTLAVMFSVSAVAGDTNSAAGGSTTTAASSSGLHWAALLIPLLTPALIAIMKWAVPKIPKVALPIAAPVIGALADIALHYSGILGASSIELTAAIGAALGTMGIGLREIYDQAKRLLSGS